MAINEIAQEEPRASLAPSASTLYAAGGRVSLPAEL
jgi:hypothetical protein